jgi:lipid II:glycine glycyltransferase (peptidoglycan interpeptide bridge formation enzyme)
MFLSGIHLNYKNMTDLKTIKYEIHNYNDEKWNKILSLFDDSSIYHTNGFIKHSIGGENAEHFVVTNSNKIIAAANVRIKKIPALNRGIAHLRWGPLWQTKNEEPNIDNFKIALEQLHKEYVVKRKFVLRITSNQFVENEINFSTIFKDAGFKLFAQPDKTIVIDLTPDEETLRKNFRKKWRYSLKQAEKKELTIVKGNDDSLFNEFIKIYQEMHGRKNFEESVDVENFRKINTDLCEENKFQIFICKHKETVLSAMVTTAFGNSGIYLLGGSTTEGLKMSSSYLLQWETMMWLKSIGKKWYDLGGIDAEANPGVYTFKTGMGGNEVTFIGGFEAGKDFISKNIIRLGEMMKNVKR